MSNDPKRLLEGDPGAGDAARGLLQGAADVEPPAGAKEASWAALAARLPASGGGNAPPDGGPGPSPAPGAGSGAAFGVKAMLGLVGAAIVIAGGSALIMRTSPAGAPVATSTPTPTASPSDALATITAGPAASGSAAPADIAAAPPPTTSSVPMPRATGSASRLKRGAGSDPEPLSAVAPMSATDALRDENALISAARSSLRRGDGSAALASLETARVRHPKGALSQEREVLTIEALSQTGDTAGASQRATAFLRAFSTSPHAAHVRTFVR